MSSKSDLLDYVHTLSEDQSQKILDMIKNTLYPGLTDVVGEKAFTLAEDGQKGKLVY